MKPSAVKILEVFESNPQWVLGVPKRIEPLAGGLTNESYFIELAVGRFVVRMAADESEALGIDRHAELEIMQHASRLKIAPRLIFSDIQAGVQVCEYVEGRHWQTDDFDQPLHRQALWHLLSSIATIPAPESSNLPAYWLQCYWRIIYKRNDAELTDTLKPLRDGMLPYLSCKFPVMAHSDLIPDNLIITKDGRLLALDWEYAGLRDPLFDLAMLLEKQALSKHDSATYLREYLGDNYSETSMQVFEQQRLLVKYLGLMWHVAQGASREWIISEAQKLGESLYHLNHDNHSIS